MYQIVLSNYKHSLTVKSKWGTKKIVNFENLKIGDDLVQVWGNVAYDSFLKRDIVIATCLNKLDKSKLIKQSNAKVKRVEFHAHTKMSTMDSIVGVDELIERASIY